MHVVAEVRDDEGEVREPVAGKVAAEPREGDDAVAACPRAGNVAEVEERVVLLRVPAGRATGEPGIREILGVCLPRLTCGRESVGKVAGVDDALGAVVRDPVRRAGDEREVVRKARMRHGVVLRQGRVAARELVERRRVGVAGDRRRLVVLEDDDNHAGEVRQPHGGRRHLRDGRPYRAARATGSEEPRERKGQRDSARYSRFSSHFLPKWVKKKPIRTTPAIATAA